MPERALEDPFEPLHAIQAPGGPRLEVLDLPMAWLAHRRYDAVISLVDPGTVLDWGHPRQRVFEVDDVERDRGAAPDVALVRALLDVDLAGASSVLIHCHGGFSRSPAAAMLWAAQLGAGLRAIERGIDWTRADPNRLILALGEAQLGLGRTLRELAARRTGRRDVLPLL